MPFQFNPCNPCCFVPGCNISVYPAPSSVPCYTQGQTITITVTGSGISTDSICYIWEGSGTNPSGYLICSIPFPMTPDNSPLSVPCNTTVDCNSTLITGEIIPSGTTVPLTSCDEALGCCPMECCSEYGVYTGDNSLYLTVENSGFFDGTYPQITGPPSGIVFGFGPGPPTSTGQYAALAEFYCNSETPNPACGWSLACGVLFSGFDESGNLVWGNLGGLACYGVGGCGSGNIGLEWNGQWYSFGGQWAEASCEDLYWESDPTCQTSECGFLSCYYDVIYPSGYPVPNFIYNPPTFIIHE